MGTSLNGLTPAGTYPGLIKTGDNAPIDGTLKTLSDGNGNNLPMEASTTAVNFTGTLTQAGATLQPTLVSGTNIKTINGTSVLGSGNIVTPSTNPSGVAGAIQFSNGSAFASDAANLFWDDANKRLGVGTNAPTASIQATTFKSSSINDTGTVLQFLPSYNIYTLSSFAIGAGDMAARLGVKGYGSTSATTSLLVQNSVGTPSLKIDDSGVAKFGGSGINGTLEILRSADQSTVGRINQNSNIFQFQELSGVGMRFLDGFGGTPLYLASAKASINKNAVAETCAQFEVVSTTGGILFPRMTTTQKNAIASPASGLQVYDTTLNQMSYYNGSSWVNF